MFFKKYFPIKNAEFYCIFYTSRLNRKTVLPLPRSLLWACSQVTGCLPSGCHLQAFAAVLMGVREGLVVFKKHKICF